MNGAGLTFVFFRFFNSKFLGGLLFRLNAVRTCFVYAMRVKHGSAKDQVFLRFIVNLFLRIFVKSFKRDSLLHSLDQIYNGLHALNVS